MEGHLDLGALRYFFNAIKRLQLKLPFLAYVAGFSALLPFAIGFLRRKSLDEGLNWFCWLLFFDLAVSGGQLILNFYKIKNLWLSHLFVLVQFSFVIGICAKWVETAVVRKLFLISIALFSALWIISRFTFEPITVPTTYVTPIAKAILVAISLYMISSIAQSSEQLSKEPRYWIVSGIVISSAGSLLFYAFRGIIDKFGRDELLIAYSVHWAIDIVANIIYSIGFLCRQPTPGSGGPLASAQ